MTGGGQAAMHEIDAIFPALGSGQAVQPAGTATSGPAQTPGEPATPGKPATLPDTAANRPETDTVSIEALFPARDIRLVIDEATHILQVQVRDPATGQMLREYPDAAWLKVSAALREFAGQAIIDTST